MNLHTDLKGRLRNINLPKTNPLLPLFEAVVNSIHTIDERILQKELDMENSFITVKIMRSAQTMFDKEKPELIGFEIVDNGIGFTKNNYDSFQTLDSTYKLDKGCRGIGRLLWLKAFQNVEVNSVYTDIKGMRIRTFKFDAESDISNEKDLECEEQACNVETHVKLNGIKKEYITYLPKTAQPIANALLEHCLWYFLRDGGAPNIACEDMGENVSLNKMFDDSFKSASNVESFSIKGKSFDLIHVKLKTDIKEKNTISYSAATRLVKQEPLKDKIPGLFGRLREGEESFSYMCFASSDYLTSNVTQERSEFTIPETLGELCDVNEISFSEIRNEIVERVRIYLNPYLEENKRTGQEKLINFVNQKAPRYRPILNRMADDEKIVDPEISDKDLELKLHKVFTELESEMLSKGHDLLKPSISDDENTYSQKLESYLSQVNDLKKSDLAGYVAHRKVILDLFAKALEIQTDGNYKKEKIIHKLIMPMITTTEDVLFDNCNFWLIDERLAFHDYLSSDKTLKSIPITGASDTKEPDILALNVYDSPLLLNDGQNVPLASITVVELKRPMRTDIAEGEDKNPIEQALGYVERIRQGSVKTRTGRLIPGSRNIPAFCYILCDLTEKMIERCKLQSLNVTSDKLGYFGYNNNYNAYIEVLSFDRLLNGARERNKSFFDKLGLPTT